MSLGPNLLSANDNVVFAYDAIDESGRLSQGEIVSGVQEPILITHDGQIDVSQEQLQFELITHNEVVILTPDCDLFADFFHRFVGDSADKAQSLNHVVCCEVFNDDDIRQRIPSGSETWRRIRKDQDQRYQHIPSGPLEGQEAGAEPDYYLDFKQTFTLQTEVLYESIRLGVTQRKGVIPQPWIYSLIQRFLAFHGRVGLPDPSDTRQLVNQADLLAVPPLTRPQ